MAMPPADSLQHEPLAPRFWVPLGVVVLAAASLALHPSLVGGAVAGADRGPARGLPCGAGRSVAAAVQ